MSAVTQLVTVPSDGTYTTTSGGGTNNLPATAFVPTSGKQYRIRLTAWAVAGSGDRAMIVSEGQVFKDGATLYLCSPQTTYANTSSAGDLAGALAVINISGGVVRAGVTGVALYALTWGAQFEIIELPNA